VTNFHKIHHGLDLGGVITFFPIINFVIGGGDCIKMTKKIRTPNGNLKILKNFFVTLWVHNFCIQIQIEKLSREK
jgi:hypothetical protein